MTQPDNSGFMPDNTADDAPELLADVHAAPSPAAMPLQRPERPAAVDDDSGSDDLEADEDDGDPERWNNPRAARKLRTENQNLRSRAKSAESERDALRDVLTGYHRGEVERLAASDLADVRDLLDRHPVDDFVTDGRVDPAKVDAAVATLVADRPHLAAQPVVTTPPSDRPIEGLRSGASPDRKPEPASWSGALRPHIGK